MADHADYSEHPAMFKNHPFGFLIALLLIPTGIGIVVLLIWYLKCKGELLQIKDGEILFETGLLSKDRIEITMKSVRTVKVSQSFTDRIFGVGTIKLFTAGDSPEFVTSGMPDPNRIRELIKAEQSDENRAAA